VGSTRLIDNVGVAVGTGFLERATEPPSGTAVSEELTSR
jgi:pantoate--beta-alanine ligase